MTTMPSKVHEEYLGEHGTWIDVHVKSRAKVEGNGAVVGSDVDVLCKGTAGDEACTFLKADYVPWSVEVSCQGTRILAMCKDQGSRRGPATGRLFQELWGRFPTCVKMRDEEWHVCLPSKSAGCARSGPSRCHLLGHYEKASSTRRRSGQLSGRKPVSEPSASENLVGRLTSGVVGTRSSSGGGG